MPAAIKKHKLRICLKMILEKTYLPQMNTDKHRIDTFYLCEFVYISG
jgi:hypothetical protein